MLLLLTSDSPKHHWFIKKEETEYILANIPISEPIKKVLLLLDIITFIIQFFNNMAIYIDTLEENIHFKSLLGDFHRKLLLQLGRIHFSNSNTDISE